MKIFPLVVFAYFSVFITGCQDRQKPIMSTPDIKEEVVQDSNKNVENRVFGKSLNLDIETIDFSNATLYKPKKVDLNEKLPVVLFAPGWGSSNHLNYKTLLTFIASQGHIVIYASSPMAYNAQTSIDRFLEVLNDQNVLSYIDKRNIGVVGHSSGGGIAFKVMDYFLKNGYGSKGKFIFSMDPWFAFGMQVDTFEKFPHDTKVVIQQYDKATETDPRIALTIFERLSILGDRNRDYQVYNDLGHGYPFGAGTFDSMQTILKPLDALMDYVFYENIEAYESALALGSDDPYHDLSQRVSPSSTYEYKCYGEDRYLTSALNAYGLDYCAIGLGF